jgi:hypothetical protein
MAWIRRQQPVLLIAVFGMLVALAAFFATSLRAADAPADFDFQNASGRPGGIRLSPYAQEIRLSGFDPWTGQPFGWSFTEHPHGIGTPTTTYGPIPGDIVGRWAIPLPVGFAGGAFAGVLLIAMARRPERRLSPVAS